MADSQINDAFRGTSSAAVEMLEKMETAAQVETPPVAATVETPAPVAAAPTPSTETPAPTTPQPIDISDDTPVRIKVQGEEKVVTAKEYKEILQRTDVFTQRQQALAQQTRQLEEHYAQREAYLQQQAQALAQYQQQLAQQGDPVQRLAQALQPQKAEPDPRELATIGELKQALGSLQQQIQTVRQQDAQTFQQTLNQRLEQERMELAIAEDQRRFSGEVAKVLSSEDGKMLLALNPKAEAILRFETLQMQPQDTAQAIENLHQYARDWAGRVRGHFSQQQTAQAVQKAQVVMEPPVGHTPPVAQAPKPVALKKDGSIDWDALRNRALSMLEQ